MLYALIVIGFHCSLILEIDFILLFAFVVFGVFICFCYLLLCGFGVIVMCLATLVCCDWFDCYSAGLFVGYFRLPGCLLVVLGVGFVYL